MMRIEQWLRRQDGVITMRRATAAGLTSRGVRHRVASGRWERLHPRRVYRVTDRRLSDRARLRAAVLWAGPRAAVTGLAAAWWLGLVDDCPDVIEITVARDRQPGRQPGIRVRRRSLTRVYSTSGSRPDRRGGVGAQIGAGRRWRRWDAHSTTKHGAYPAVVAPTAARRLLLVHSHPDDESITTGGTIARYAAAPDTHVTLVTCTLGEEGEVMCPELAGLAVGEADQLGGYRVAELIAAGAALGLRDQRFLGGVGRWRDSGMVAGYGVLATVDTAAPESLHTSAFAAAGRADQVAELAAIMDEVRPQVVIGYDPLGGYGHPDHVRAHEITMAAAAEASSVCKVYWTVAPRFDVQSGLAELAEVDGLPWLVAELDELACVPDASVTTRIDVRAQLPAKLAALRAHATQLTVWHSGAHAAFALTNEIAQPVPATECYTLVGAARSVRAHETETDLFEGIEA